MKSERLERKDPKKGSDGLEMQFLDNSEVKRLLKISTSTLLRWRQQKRIPFKKIGGKCYYPYEIIKAMLLQTSV